MNDSQFRLFSIKIKYYWHYLYWPTPQLSIMPLLPSPFFIYFKQTPHLFIIIFKNKIICCIWLIEVSGNDSGVWLTWWRFYNHISGNLLFRPINGNEPFKGKVHTDRTLKWATLQNICLFFYVLGFRIRWKCFSW